jgi:hypothetical protein
MVLGLFKGVFTRAWLTVLDGGRPGRQLILSDVSAAMGRAGHVALAFPGSGDDGLEPVHAIVTRQPDGRFALEDHHTRVGTSINDAPVSGRHVLNDGDTIQIGANTVRFNDRTRRPKPVAAPVVTVTPPTRDARAPVPPARPVPAEPVVPAKPAATAPARSGPPRAEGRRPASMSPCPKCGRPVPGTRPHCVKCNLSF